MAGDWIKMRVGLTNHPRVLRIAECLLEDGDFLEWSGLSFGMAGYPAPDEATTRAERHAALRVTRYVTVTALLKFWGYANEHAKGDSIPGVWQEDVDEITGVPGFAAALEAIGWAEFDQREGGLVMPNFEEHNTSATERGSAAAERQKRYRERKKLEAEQAANSDVTRDVTVTPREEKRREEKKTTNTGGGRFAEFWAEYPKKVGKGAAEKAFAKVDAAVPELVSAIRQQEQTEQWRKDKGRFIPHPATWLNEKRWLDAVEPIALTAQSDEAEKTKRMLDARDKGYVPPSAETKARMDAIRQGAH